MKKLAVLILVLIVAYSAYAVNSINTVGNLSMPIATRTSAYSGESSPSADMSGSSINRIADADKAFIPVISSVDCPSGAGTEAETCGDDTNGGCTMDSGSESFETINCGDIVCGTYWSDDITRDLDWYELVLTEQGFIKWIAVGEAPTQIWMYNGDAGCSDAVYLASTKVDPEDTAAIELELLPGTYWLVVGPDDWYDMPCDGSGDYTNDYVVMVECELGTPVVEVTPDSIYAEAIEGFTASETLSVANIGEGRLEFTATASQDYITTLVSSKNQETIDWDYLNIETLLATENSREYQEFISNYSLIEEYESRSDPVVTTVDCPTDGIAESEACGDNTNDGCAMSSGSEAWETLNCNTTVCGTVWSDDTTRDTDWYLMSLSESTQFRWAVTADFPLMTILLLPGETGNGCSDYEALLIDIISPGDTALFLASLPAGDYWLWVGPTAWYDMPCDGSGEYPNDYVATFTCEPPWLNIDVINGTIHEGDPAVEINVLLDATDLLPDTYTGNISISSNDTTNNPFDVPVVFLVKKSYMYLPGDANMGAGNWPPIVDGADVTYIINYLTSRNLGCKYDGFFASADANGDCYVFGSDVSYIVYYLRGLGDPPSYCTDFPYVDPIEETYPECEVLAR